MSPRSKELSEKMKAKSRRAIISAGLELFAKKGFSGTTADEIARKARVSKGLIFSYFRTKQDILIAIIDEEINLLFRNSVVDADMRSPKEKLISMIEVWLQYMKDEPLWIRLSLRLNLDDGWRKLMRRKGKQYLELYLGKIRDLFVQLGSQNPDLDCYLLAIFFDGITANYFVAPELFPVDAIKNHFIETLFSRLKTDHRQS